jgi:hypothetical protein
MVRVPPGGLEEPLLEAALGPVQEAQQPLRPHCAPLHDRVPGQPSRAAPTRAADEGEGVRVVGVQGEGAGRVHEKANVCNGG